MNFRSISKLFGLALLTISTGAIIGAMEKKHEIVSAIRDGDLEAVKQCLANGVHVDQAFLGYGIISRPLLMAMQKGEIGIVKYLIAKGANVNVIAGERHSPLEIAIFAKEIDQKIIKILIKKGVDISTSAERGIGPLGVALSECNLEAVKLLVAAGAGINSPIGFNRKSEEENYTLPPLAYVMYKCRRLTNTPILYGKYKNIAEYLIMEGANIEYSRFGGLSIRELDKNCGILAPENLARLRVLKQENDTIKLHKKRQKLNNLAMERGRAFLSGKYGIPYLNTNLNQLASSRSERAASIAREARGRAEKLARDRHIIEFAVSLTSKNPKTLNIIRNAAVRLKIKEDKNKSL